MQQTTIHVLTSERPLCCWTCLVFKLQTLHHILFSRDCCVCTAQPNVESVVWAVTMLYISHVHIPIISQCDLLPFGHHLSLPSLLCFGNSRYWSHSVGEPEFCVRFWLQININSRQADISLVSVVSIRVPKRMQQWLKSGMADTRGLSRWLKFKFDT